jgi:hypothetical protein
VKSAKKKLLQERAEAALQVRTPAAEQLLIKEIPALSGEKILCTSLGRGQFAQMAASYFPQAQVTCQFFDKYLADEAIQHCVAEQGGAGEGKLVIACAADFPAETFDLVVIPVDSRGESELTRDLLQSGHDRLEAGGRLLTATSNCDAFCSMRI